jgi:hypothetical protein
MPIAGARKGPIQGVKGSKPPILKNQKGEPRRRLPKLPATPDALDLQQLSSQYLRERNAQMKAKRLVAEMELAFKRNQLIEKSLVERQLAWLLVSMRQSLLSLPVKIANHFGNRDVSIRDIVPYVERAVHETLKDLARLPDSAEPRWLEKLEDEEK